MNEHDDELLTPYQRSARRARKPWTEEQRANVYRAIYGGSASGHGPIITKRQREENRMRVIRAREEAYVARKKEERRQRIINTATVEPLEVDGVGDTR